MNIALERAVTEGYLKGKEEVEIKWYPFFLDPTLPIKGRDKLKGYQAKFGAERTAQILPYMTSVGKTGVLHFLFVGCLVTLAAPKSEQLGSRTSHMHA